MYISIDIEDEGSAFIHNNMTHITSSTVSYARRPESLHIISCNKSKMMVREQTYFIFVCLMSLGYLRVWFVVPVSALSWYVLLVVLGL